MSQIARRDHLPEVIVIDGVLLDGMFACRCGGSHGVVGGIVRCCCGDSHEIDFCCGCGHFHEQGACPSGPCSDYRCCVG